MMQLKYLEKFENELNTCIRCAYCFEGCPVFQQLGWEIDSARGKAVMGFGLLMGHLEPNNYIAKKFFQCTFCRDCVERCSANVNIPGLIAAVRAELVKEGFAYDTHKTVIENVKRTGNIFGDEEVAIPLKDGEIPLFIGCQYLARPNQTKLYLRMLEKLGINVKVVKEICCGFPMYALGFREDFEAWKEKFNRVFPYDEFIALCPTCTAFLQEEYGKKVKHILQVILEYLPEANLELKVTYHDPCDLSRGLGIIEEPRKILNKLGVEVIEMQNAGKTSRCCGGGGGILMSDVELSDAIAMTRIREAVETGAELLVTSCPTCEQVLKKAATELKKSGEKSITVRNISEIIWRGIRG